MSDYLVGGVVMMVGRRGAGKTHRVREHIVRLAGRGRQVIVFDPSKDIYGNAKEPGLRSYYAGRSEGEQYWIQSYDSVDKAEAHIRNGQLNSVMLRRLPRIVVINPPKVKHTVVEGARFQSLMLEHCEKGWVWVSDEAELVFVGHGIGNTMMPLISLARNHGSLLIVACKDPIRVSMDVRRGCDAALIFALNTDDAVEALKTVVNPRIVENATKLPKRRFWYVGPATNNAGRPAPVLLDADDDLPDDL